MIGSMVPCPCDGGGGGGGGDWIPYQITNEAIKEIEHGLNALPVEIVVTDLAGNELMPMYNVRFVDGNTVIIDFGSNFTGIIYIRK